MAHSDSGRTPSRRLAMLAGSALTLALTPLACGQWLSYADQTATRIQLSTVPNNDPEEKDLGVGDLNKDGWPDLIVIRKEPFSNIGPRVDVLLMNENGVLVDRTTQYAPGFAQDLTDGRDVAIVDIDNDGWLDAVIATTFDDAPKIYRNLGKNQQGQWLGLADESFRIGPIITSPWKMCGVTPGDIDNDGDMDLYYANYLGGTDTLLVNNGSGFFTDQTPQRLGQYAVVAFGTGAELGDWDKDGDVDILKISTLFGVPPFGVGVYILWNNGQGDFDSIPFKEVQPTSSPYMFAARDFDNDSDIDFYILQDPQDRTLVTTIVGQHNLTWTSKQVSANRTSGFGGNIAIGDLDLDGDLDLGICPIDVDIANCGGPTDEFALLRNDGTGGFSDPMPSINGWNAEAHDATFVDINRDGCLDIVLGLCTGYRVFVNSNCKFCYADCDKNKSLNVFDYICYGQQYTAQSFYADCNLDGQWNVFDYICFGGKYSSGCP